jgi:hypothetical protein
VLPSGPKKCWQPVLVGVFGIGTLRLLGFEFSHSLSPRSEEFVQAEYP